MTTDSKVAYVIWSDDRRAWVAAEGSGMFYTTNPDDVRQFNTQDEAEKWAKSTETVQRWIGG